jgi:hypothetical protein
MLPLLVCAAILQNGVIVVPDSCQMTDQDLLRMYQRQTQRHLPSRVIDPNANRLRWLEH